MKRTVRAAAATLLAASALTALPVAAHAATATGTDPTGDVAAGPTYDVTSLSVELTTSTVKVITKFAGAMPALSDSSWATEDRDGRFFYISLGDEIGYPSFVVLGDGVIAIPAIFRLGNETCDDATIDVTGDTITVAVAASCFNNPGKIEAQALVAKSLESGLPDTDIAIAPQLTDSTTDDQLTSVDVSLPGGYYQLAGDGGVFAFGDAGFYGSTGNIKLNKPVVSMTTTPTGKGYWFTASDGGIFAYGDAPFFGSTGSIQLNKPIVGMARTPTGAGYWLVASDGGVFAYGDAPFYGSTGSTTLNKPIVGMMTTPTGAGYWLVASDGGVFAYGDAKFFGSTGNLTLNSPIIGMVPTTTGNGYWLAAQDGGIFAYGDAQFYGSGANYFDNDVVAIGRSADGAGYYLQSAWGDLMNYGSALDYGDMYRLQVELNQPMVGLAVKP